MHEFYSDDDTVNIINPLSSMKQEQKVDVLFCDTNSIAESTEMETSNFQRGRKRKFNHDNSMDMEREKIQKRDRMCDIEEKKNELFERYLNLMERE